MPGYMLRNNPTGHPVMGEIGPRRTAVFIGYAYHKSYIGRSASFPFGKSRLASQVKCASHRASPFLMKKLMR